MSTLDQEYKTWCKQRGIDIPTSENLNEFLEERNLPKRIKRDVTRWLADHPEFVDTKSNWGKVHAWLDVQDKSALYENLNAAYAHLRKTGGLVLNKVTPPSDPNKPETRPGRWRNGAFVVDPNYVPKSEIVYAQHSAPPINVGQSDPAKVAAGELIVRKSVANMTADEYLHSLSSRPFQKKMDES